MSNSRDPSVDGRSRAGARTGTAPVRDPTESLVEGEDLDPLSSSQAPLGTRDAVRSRRDDATRVESPAARQRTPQPPEPPRSKRSSRPSRPPRSIERPEERLGQVLGSYRLVELLGKGGMGFVYRAEHVKLGRPVALKLLRADYARRRDAVARFFQEARTVNRVRHRNIVDVTDFVELDDGTTFIIMELLEGRSLGRWARDGFSVPRALALLVQMCDGLAAAHAVGVIHRDLKPDNVVVVPTGDGAEQVKLLDFGVAKLLNRDDEDIGLETQAGSVIGTPAYMSPEQAGGTTVDVRSDIYSLGAIMYELFCGEPMFKGRSFGEFVRKHLNEQPQAPRATRGGAGMDERIEQVILRCIEKDPARRYPSLVELRDDLLHLLGGIETAVGLVGSSFVSSRDVLPSSSRRTPAPLPPAMAVAPRRRWRWAVAAIVVAATGGATYLIATSGSGPNPHAPTAKVTPKEPPPKPAVLTPEITPLGTPAAKPGPSRIVAVRIDSTPSAELFEIGSASRTCPTPCDLQIDLSDGGSTSHRDYVLRADGYVDQPVSVPLDHPPGALTFTLEKRASPHGHGEPEPRPEPQVATPQTPPEPKHEEPAPTPPNPTPPKETNPKSHKTKSVPPPTKTIDPFAPH